MTAKKTGLLCDTHTHREEHTYIYTYMHIRTLTHTRKHSHTHSHSHLQSHFAIVNTLNCATWAHPRIRLTLPALPFLPSPASLHTHHRLQRNVCGFLTTSRSVAHFLLFLLFFCLSVCDFLDLQAAQAAACHTGNMQMSWRTSLPFTWAPFPFLPGRAHRLHGGTTRRMRNFLIYI